MATNMTPKLLICAVLVLSFMADSCLADEGYKAKFRGFLGRVVAKRTYPTEEMKNQALELWKDKGVILELDGTTSKPEEEHAAESQESVTVPAVSETSSGNAGDDLVDSSGQKLEPLPPSEPIPVTQTSAPTPLPDGCNQLSGVWNRWHESYVARANVSGNSVTFTSDDGQRIQGDCKRTGATEWLVGGATFQIKEDSSGKKWLTVYKSRSAYSRYSVDEYIWGGDAASPNVATAAVVKTKASTPASQPRINTSQDCSVLNGTWRTTFNSSKGDKTMDWKWQVNGSRVTMEMYETTGKFLSSSPVDQCSVNGNTVTYQMGSSPQIRLELAGDRQSFNGTNYANGMQVNFKGQRTGGGAPTASQNIKLDEGAIAVVDMDTVGTSRSFSFKRKKSP